MFLGQETPNVIHIVNDNPPSEWPTLLAVALPAVVAVVVVALGALVTSRQNATRWHRERTLEEWKYRNIEQRTLYGRVVGTCFSLGELLYSTMSEVIGEKETDELLNSDFDDDEAEVSIGNWTPSELPSACRQGLRDFYTAWAEASLVAPDHIASTLDGLGKCLETVCTGMHYRKHEEAHPYIRIVYCRFVAKTLTLHGFCRENVLSPNA
jgi:hypothetical protein